MEYVLTVHGAPSTASVTLARAAPQATRPRTDSVMSRPDIQRLLASSSDEDDAADAKSGAATEGTASDSGGSVDDAEAGADAGWDGLDLPDAPDVGAAKYDEEHARLTRVHKLAYWHLGQHLAYMNFHWPSQEPISIRSLGRKRSQKEQAAWNEYHDLQGKSDQARWAVEEHEKIRDAARVCDKGESAGDGAPGPVSPATARDVLDATLSKDDILVLEYAGVAVGGANRARNAVALAARYSKEHADNLDGDALSLAGRVFRAARVLMVASAALAREPILENREAVRAADGDVSAVLATLQLS